MELTHAEVILRCIGFVEALPDTRPAKYSRGMNYQGYKYVERRLRVLRAELEEAQQAEAEYDTSAV